MAERPTYVELEHRIALLENESAHRKRFEEINRSLFKISEAVSTTSSLDELFRKIHLALSSIIDTTNFFIAIYDEKKDSITFPYRVDSVDDCYPPVIEVSRSASLTAEVIRTGRPVFVTKAERLTNLSRSTLIKPGCTPAEIWMGAPLKTRNEIIGVMAVQSYHDPMCYDQTDIDVMVSVADQVAIAVERKQAEDALRESETRYRSVLETISDGVILQSASGEILTWNKGAEDIFGILAKETIGRRSENKEWSTIHEDGSKYEGKDHPSMRTLQTGKPYRNEIMGVYRPSGELRWISINTNPLFGTDEVKPNAVVISFADITEIKKEKDQSQMFLDATTDGIWSWNFKTNTFFFSHKYYKMLGYAPDAFPADYDHWVDLIHPDDRKKALVTAAEHLRAKPDDYENEFRLRTAGGDYRLIRSRARVVERDTSGEAVMIVGNHEDITERRLAQDAFRKSQFELLEAQRLAGLGSWTYDPVCKQPIWSEGMFLIWGLDPKDGAPKYSDHKNFIHPDDFPRFDTAVKEALELGKPYELELRVRRPDGLEKSIITICEPQFDDVGKVVTLRGTNQDITELKRTVEALRESEQKYRRLTENSPDMIYRMSLPDGRYEYVSSAAASVFGYPPEVWYDTPFLISKIIHPDLHSYFEKQWENLLKGHVPQTYEYKIIHKDESIRWINQRNILVKDDKGHPVAIEGVATDITDRRQAEDMLRLSENKLRATLDAAPFPIAVVDLQDDTIFYWSRSALTLFGHTATTTSEWYQIAYPDPDYRDEVIQRWKSFLEKARQSGQPINTGEYRVTCRDGSVLICELYATFLPNNLIVTFNDITERKQAEAEKAKLEAQNWQLQKAESLGRMAGSIAHNFNNQLQVVTGNLEMAMCDQPLGSEILEEALKAARKAAEISTLMLTYSGKQPGKYEPIDLSAACRQSITLLQAAAPKGTMLKADLPPSGPVIRGNTGQIQQVIINLATNAWESADESRRGIGLTVMTVSRKDIPAFKRFPAGWNPQVSAYACLDVADAGSGISSKDIENIFDPFYTSKFTGRGMGLSVVLGIVKAHNGGITVESLPGRGSIFRVFFPLSTEEILCQPDKQIQSPEKQDGGTVLLIEDEDQVRKMARTMLTHLGYTVLEAKDGIDALEIFRQNQNEICCVLSDLTMPGMNGWDTLVALRRLSPDIPVILSSGYDEARVLADEHTERPNTFLGKPYRLQELRDIIRQTLADKNKASPELVLNDE